MHILQLQRSRDILFSELVSVYILFMATLMQVNVHKFIKWCKIIKYILLGKRSTVSEPLNFQLWFCFWDVHTINFFSELSQSDSGLSVCHYQGQVKSVLPEGLGWKSPLYLSKIPTCPHQIFLPKIPTNCKNLPTFFKKPNNFF